MNRKHLVVFFAAAVASQAHSAPSVYTQNSELREISEPRASAMMIGDSAEPNKVWVLPPHTGMASVTDLTATGSMNRCIRTKTLLKYAQEREETRLGYAVDLRKYTREAKRLKVDVDQKMAAIDKLLENPNLKKMVDIQSKIDRLEKELDKLYEDLNKAESEEEIKTLQAEIRAKTAERSRAQVELSELKAEHQQVWLKYQRAKQGYDSAKESYDEKIEQVEETKERLAKVENMIRGLFKHRAKIVGAMAHINFDRLWEREVERLNIKHSPLTFEPLPTYNARLSLAMVPTNSKGKLYTDLPALIGYGTFGTELFYGERLGQNDPQRSATGVPDQVEPNLSINLLGACPLVDDTFFEDYDFDVKRGVDGKPAYSLTVTFEYDAIAPFNVKVSYNLWQIYQMIAKQSPLYGSITPKTIHELVKKPWPKELVSIQGAESYPAANRSQLEQEIKSELINRVLTTVAKPSPGDLSPVPALGLPPVEGAFALSYGQNASCGTNIYCQTGRWIVRIGDAVFGEKVGGKQARSKMFKKGWDKMVTETWDAANPVPRQGISQIGLKAKPALDPAIVDRAYNAYNQVAAATFPAGVNVEERSIFYGFHVANSFDKDILGETGLRPLIQAIFGGNNTAVELKTITSKEQFKQLVFPGESASRIAARRHASDVAKPLNAGGWASVQQIDRAIDGDRLIERLNAGTLPVEEQRELEQLLEYREALQLAAIDRRLAEIKTMMQRL